MVPICVNHTASITFAAVTLHINSVTEINIRPMANPKNMELDLSADSVCPHSMRCFGDVGLVWKEGAGVIEQKLFLQSSKRKGNEAKLAPLSQWELEHLSPALSRC